MNNQQLLQLTLQQRDRLTESIRNFLNKSTGLEQNIIQTKTQAKAREEELYLELLEIFDSLDFLINYLGENQEVTPALIKRLPKNIGSIQKKLLSILGKRQVNRIDFTPGEADYSYCQVVDQEVNNDLPEKTVTKVVRAGFRLEEKLLRPVEVIVSKKSVGGK